MLLNICVALLTLSQGMILYLLLGLLPAISSGSQGGIVDENGKACLTEQSATVLHEQTNEADEHPEFGIENTCSPVSSVIAQQCVTVYPIFNAQKTSVATTLERAPPQIQILDIASYQFVV